MDFLQIDVFADRPFGGNPLAVFPEAASLGTEQMQAIAREMNLSETSFVTGIHADSYDVRIFTPAMELAFAGHPTIGTAWVLRQLGHLEGETVTQRSLAGETPVTSEGDELWFVRPGKSEPDREDTQEIAAAFGLEPGDVGFDWDGSVLAPAFADAGVSQLMLPVRDVAALGRAAPNNDRLNDLGCAGAYCFTAAGPGQLRSRGFFPGFGVPEDPATGSAAAALGIYLGDRVGALEVSIAQGVEMGRPSRIELRAEPGHASIGGSSHLVMKGRLEALP